MINFLLPIDRGQIRVWYWNLHF